MMKIRILFFAAYRELLGRGELTMEMPEGSAVAELLQALWGREGPYGLLPAAPVVAVNRDFASLETRLEDGDEVAFIPPVAGG